MTVATKSHAPRIIALMNQKGGVGKTTTTVNLGAALAELRKDVLLIDMDPQAHLSLHVGLNPDALDASVYDLLLDERVSAGELIHRVDKRLAVLPAEVGLAAAESELVNTPDRQTILSRKLEPIVGWFDYILIDCPPSLGLLTLNALGCAREVIVPMQAHFLALQGLSKLLETVQLVRQNFNPDLSVAGVVLALHDGQTTLSREVVADLEAFFEQARGQEVPWREARVLQPPIRRNVKLAECPSFGQTIFQYATTCGAAMDYLALAKSLVKPATKAAPQEVPPPPEASPEAAPEVAGPPKASPEVSSKTPT